MPAEQTQTAAEAAQDLDFIRDVVQRTDLRVDPHAFHYVHWGAIVLVWFPLANLFQRQERFSWMIALGIGSVVLGILLSTIREIRLSKKPRIEGNNTFLARQTTWVTFLCLGAGMVLSAISVPHGFIDGPHIPTLWGLVYANMAAMLGVIYRRAFLWAALVIFAGCIAAIVFPAYNGFILGPCMGLGLIIPGLQAEGRVKRMQAQPHGV